LLGLARKHLGDDVISITGQEDPDVGQARVVHFTKYRSRWQHRIPLLLSSAGMLYGGEKQLLIDRAEKIVYFAAEVYSAKSMRKNR
jgi:hypothetical protein